MLREPEVRHVYGAIEARRPAHPGEFMAAGKVTPVIDRRYKLSEVPEAIRYVEEGHARGKVVITLD